MKYPRDMVRKVEAVLSRRRQAALQGQEKQRAMLATAYPDVLKAYLSLSHLEAELGMALFRGADGAAALLEEIDAKQRELGDRLAEAGLTRDCFEPAYRCTKCGDTGEAAGRICTCKQRLLNRMAYEKLCDASQVEDCSFENFSLRYYADADQAAMKKVWISCQKYVARFSHSSANLLFTGATGLGKTHLSLAIANGVIQAGNMVLYVSAPQLIGQLERSKFHNEEDADSYRELVYGCDLLVIDDLGTEMATKYVQAEVYELLNSRLLGKLPTIISTNLRLYELEKRYTDRVSSRLAGGYVEIPFQGRDIRMQKRKEDSQCSNINA